MKKSMYWLITVALLAGLSAQARVPEGDLLEGVSPGADGKIDVLAVAAHPDDESIYEGGTLIKLKKDPRVRLHLLCMTLGDASDAKYFMGLSSEEMAEVRTKELHNAGQALGADEVIQLQHHDQGLKPADQDALVEEVAGIIGRTGAEIVITHDPGGVTRHPDHVTTSRVVTEAFAKSSAQRLYYATLPTSMYFLYGLTSPFHASGQAAKPEIRVDISKELKQKRKAIGSHRSQMRHSLVGPIAVRFYWVKNEWFAVGGSKD